MLSLITTVRRPSPESLNVPGRGPDSQLHPGMLTTWSRPEQAPGAAGHSVLLVPSALPLHLVPDPPPAAPLPLPGKRQVS